MDHSPAKIFLSEQRSFVGNSRYRAHCTFDEHREPFGNLFLFNDEVLAAGAEFEMITAFAAYVVLIPVTGELLYRDKDGCVSDLDVGQVMISRKEAGESFRVMNVYEDEEIHYLHIQVKDTGFAGFPSTHIANFSMEEARNRLISIITGQYQPFRLSIGQFGGREKAVFSTSDAGTGLFSFVLSGAFEMEDRLLHPHDGLALWDTNQVELEALSNDATLLIVEMENYK